MAEKYDMSILYSCHTRSRKRLEQSGFHLDKRVIQLEPLGFYDYNCLADECVLCCFRLWNIAGRVGKYQGCKNHSVIYWCCG